MPLRAAALLPLLLACSGPDKDTSIGPESCNLSLAPRWYQDSDGDGYGNTWIWQDACDPPEGPWVTEPGDCDDLDSEANPGEMEVCADSQDNNCDGRTDEPVDEDLDGYDRCADDCDDGNPAVHPGAEELCDGQDNNCDGSVGNPEAGEVDESDADGDGATVCSGDCADHDPAINPSAYEACNEQDDDCDGIIDDEGDLDADGVNGCATGGGIVDLLLVIDNTSTMEVEQAQLAAEAEALVEALADQRLDWQLRVLTVEADTEVDGPARPDVGEAAEQVAAMVQVGTAGSGDERPMDALLSALRAGTAAREGAALAVWIITDEDDHSRATVDQVEEALRSRLDGHGEFVSVSTITGGEEGCTGDGGSATAAPRLLELAERMGGRSLSICDTASWSVELATAGGLPAAPFDCDDDSPLVSPLLPETCDGVDNDCDALSDVDEDGDGQGPCEGDCDETDLRRFEGNPELCDGLDNDCSGAAESGEEDVDGDGYPSCAGDCDDGDEDISPLAIEDCDDGLDNNCNGLMDLEEDTDVDGDFYSACAGDCAPEDPLVYPMAVEDPLNAIDDDCDGLADGLDPDVVTWWDLPGRTFLTYSGAWSVLFCGERHSVVGVSPEGFIQLSPTANNFDSSGTATDMASYAPILAALWKNLEVEPAGVALTSREDGFTVHWLASNSGESAADHRMDITVMETGEAWIRVFSASGSGGLTGWSCGGAATADLSALVEEAGGGCISDSSSAVSQFELWSGSPELGAYHFCE